eukprot:15485179-Alexandrium_andersonii.AAC.1
MAAPVACSLPACTRACGRAREPGANTWSDQACYVACFKVRHANWPSACRVNSTGRWFREVA